MTPWQYKMLLFDGWAQDVGGHLSDYFYREIKKGNEIGISSAEFFKNLRAIVDELRHKFYDHIARNELNILEVNNLGLPLLFLTGQKYTGHLYLSNLSYIEASIDEGCEKFIKEQGSYIYKNFEDLINDAINYNDIEIPIVQPIRGNLIQLHAIDYKEFLIKVKGIQESEFNKFLTRNSFVQYIKYQEYLQTAVKSLKEKNSSHKFTESFKFNDPTKERFLGGLYDTLKSIGAIECKPEEFRKLFSGKGVKARIKWLNTPYELNRLIHFLYNVKPEGISILSKVSNHWKVTLMCFEGKTRDGKEFKESTIQFARLTNGIKENVSKIKKSVEFFR
jgi:hypothetical protein